MSWVQIWVHVVFSTKYRKPFLNTKELRFNVFNHIKENAKLKEIHLDCINGHSDHVHCLIELGKNQSISQVSQLLKGESSYWINREKLISGYFNWQDDYWAVSVSKKHVPAVRKYIYEQEQHHQKISFSEEIETFMNKYGWSYIKDK